jgi:beta-glucanase (GH16 family)
MTGTRVVDDMGSEFHVYTLDWNSERLIFYVDGYRYQLVTNDGTHDGWPFDRSTKLYF